MANKKDLIPGGQADNKPYSDFNPKKLKEGTKVELEHTSDPDVAKEIASDHIAEFPSYYSALKTMEDRLKQGFKKSSLIKNDAPDAPQLKGKRVIPFDANEHQGKKVFVFFNLHNNLWSIRHNGKTIGHTDKIVLDQPEFKVSEAGRQRVIRDKKKNVHAGVSGFVSAEPSEHGPQEGRVRASYNPYRGPHFTEAGTENQIHAADRAHMQAVENTTGQGPKRFGHVYATNPNAIKKSTMMGELAASEMQKGQNGDWKSEGYKISEPNYTDDREEMRIRAIGPDGKKSVLGPNGLSPIAIGHFFLDHKNKTLSPVLTHTHADHQRKGLASAIYAQAEAHTGYKMEEGIGQSNDAKALWSQPNRKFGKSLLIKGAARRLYGKFDPKKELNEDFSMASWVGGNVGQDPAGKARAKIPDPSSNAKLRMTNKLSNRAQVRLNPETKQREFLLHRQMSSFEFNKTAKNGRINHQENEHTSWTPQLSTITESSGIYGRHTLDPDEVGTYNHVVSAWIPETHIKTMPVQYGETGTYNANKRGAPTYTALKEQEVIVRPGHNSQIHEVRQDTGENPKAWTWQSKKLAASEFKKSSLLQKAPILHEQPSGFETKTIDDNLFNPQYHTMVKQTTLPNGLTHHVYKHKNSEDSVVHSLSHGNPEQPVSLIAGYVEGKGPKSEYTATLTSTEPDHQGKGYGTLLKELAVKHHGKMVSDSVVSSGEDNTWNKLSTVPGVQVKRGRNQYEIASDQDLDFEHLEPEAVEELELDAAAEPHTAVYNPKMSGKFKKSSLFKGAMRRLAPWNDKSRSTTAAVQDDLKQWQDGGHRTARNNLATQKIDESSKKRTLHKLSGLTPTKLHSDGTRSFLLHRGMVNEEYDEKKSRILGQPAIEHKDASSWTPNLTISGGFADDAGRNMPHRTGSHVSAWIHENDISIMPNQHIQGGDGDDYKYEQEVIVKPGGRSPLAHRDEVRKLTGVDKDGKETYPGGKILDNPDRMINFRQKNNTSFGGDPVERNKYILPVFQSARFKKSSLISK